MANGVIFGEYNSLTLKAYFHRIGVGDSKHLAILLGNDYTSKLVNISNNSG